MAGSGAPSSRGFVRGTTSPLVGIGVAALTRVEANGLVEVLTSGGQLVEPEGLAVESSSSIFVADPEEGTFRIPLPKGL